MARRKNTTPAKPAPSAPSAFDITHVLASAKPPTCGETYSFLVATFSVSVAERIAASGCRRLPRHEVTDAKGHMGQKPLGLMTPKQREAYKASRAAKAIALKVGPAKPGTVVIDGITYRVGPEVRGAEAVR